MANLGCTLKVTKDTDDAETKDTDLQFRILKDRLHSFVEFFMIELEATFILHYQFLFGDLKEICQLDKILDDVVGSFAKDIKYACVKSSCEEVLKRSQESSSFEFNKNDEYSYLHIVCYFKKYETEGRKFFIEMAIDIFQIYEYQFLKIKSKKDLKILTIDSVYRFLNYIKNDHTSDGSKSGIPKNRLEIKNVIFGKSKQNNLMPEVATLKTKNFNLLYLKKKPGFKIMSDDKEWNTAKFFVKPGIIEIDKDIKKYFSNKQSNTKKYYFRKAFRGEEYETDNFKQENVDDTVDIQYYGSQDFYECQIEIMLRKTYKDYIFKRIFQLTYNTLERLKYDLFLKNDAKIINKIKVLLEEECEKLRAVINHKVPYFTIAEQLSGKKITNVDNTVSMKNKLKFGLLKQITNISIRKELLKNIHDEIMDKNTTVSQIVCISGSDGIGKSNLAVNFANNQSDLNTIFINSEKRETLDKSIRFLAAQLGLQTVKEVNNIQFEILKQAVDLKVIVYNLYKYLKDKGKSLIILDNVENYAVIEDVIFRGSYENISTLITARDLNLSNKIKIEEFTEHEAVNFVNNGIKNESIDEVKAIVKTLNKSSLVLGHVIAYINVNKNKIKNTGGQLKSIINEYERLCIEEKKLLDMEKNDACINVTITLSIALKNIKENEEYGIQALDILNIIAYLSPENIQVDDIFLDLEVKAVELLHKYSLIDFDNGIVRVHRLVQQSTRKHLKAEGIEEKVLGEALALLIGSVHIDSIISVWEYSCNYSQLIDDYYLKSDYTESKSNILHLLAEYRSDCDTISNILNLSNNKIDVNCKNIYGETPLYVAAKFGNINVAKFLINNGTFSKNVYYSSAIHVAASNGHKEVVQFLYSLRNTLPKNWLNLEPIDEAAINGHEDIIKILKPTNNETHINFARLVDGINKKNYEKCDKIINEIKSDIFNVRMGYKNDTILHLAAGQNDVKIFELFLNCNCNINICNKFNETPIHYAAKRGCIDVLNLLLEKGANVELVSLYKENLLHYAAFSCGVDVLNMLISKGLYFKQFDEFGRSTLHCAARSNNIDAVKFIVKQGFGINTINAFNEIALHYVSELSVSKEMIKLMIDLGAELNCVDGDGRTPLHKASFAGRYDNVMVLLDAGADIKICDVMGRTALHMASAENHLRIVKLLIKKGADPNALDYNGDSPLHLAVRENGKVSIVELLYRYGSNIEAVNKLNKSVLDIATRERKRQIVNYLDTKVTDTENLFGLFCNY